ncbi:MAG: septum formation initiator family protein, partial [Coriobacteriaceae bacterium]|nr:septum formation initiator family protein [Coriobacteriaceae bacterium]
NAGKKGAEKADAEKKAPEAAASSRSKSARATKREKVKRAPDPEFRRRLVIALVVVAAVLIMLYRPTRDLYIAWRTGYVLQERYDALAEENAELSEEVDRLMTREGIEDEARKRGYVMPGETSVKVEGLEGEPAEEPDEGTESELPWFIHVGDFIFFYREDA